MRPDVRLTAPLIAALVFPVKSIIGDKHLRSSAGEIEAKSLRPEDLAAFYRRSTLAGSPLDAASTRIAEDLKSWTRSLGERRRSLCRFRLRGESGDHAIVENYIRCRGRIQEDTPQQMGRKRRVSHDVVIVEPDGWLRFRWRYLEIRMPLSRTRSTITPSPFRLAMATVASEPSMKMPTRALMSMSVSCNPSFPVMWMP